MLPLVVGELGDEIPDASLIVRLGEVSPQGAATSPRKGCVDAAAAVTEDARPATGQPGQVSADDLCVIGRVDELHPVAGKVGGQFVGGHRHSLDEPSAWTSGQPWTRGSAWAAGSGAARAATRA